MAQSFTVVTGHTCRDDDPFGADWQELPTKGTLVILMGVRYLPNITKRLIAAGRAPETPAAVIRWGTTPQQELVLGTIADIAEKAHHIGTPAITVIGEVVTMHESLDWFVPQVETAVVDSAVQLFRQQMLVK
jgi:siroheme synthase